MARLVQKNSTPPQNSGVNIPQATRTATPSAQKVAAPVAKASRRFPRWFVPLVVVAIATTAGELGFQARQFTYTRALNQGLITEVQHKFTLPYEELASYSISPRGDKYVLGYRNEQGNHLEVYRTSGGRLWSLEAKAESPVFSHDGSRVLNGTEVRSAETGELQYRIPPEKAAVNPVWDSQGNRAAWIAANRLHIWHKASGKVSTILVPGVTDVVPSKSAPRSLQLSSELQLSPNGKWLATFVQDLRSEKSSILVWSVDAPKTPRVLPVRQVGGVALGLAFSPDSTRLLCSGSQAMKAREGEGYVLMAWVVKTGDIALNISLDGYPLQAGWSADGTHVALFGIRENTVYSASTGKQVWKAESRYQYAIADPMYLGADKRLYFLGYEEKDGDDTHPPDYYTADNRWTLEYWDLSKVLDG